MTIFNCEDYKTYLNEMIAENPQRGYLTQLAQAAGCQKSYLSQVLRAHVHLTPEQALGLASFWRLNEIEEDYFLNLVHLGRAGNPRLQQKIKTYLKRIREDGRDISKRYNSEKIDSLEQQIFYYGSWAPGAIHMAVGIPSLRTATAIAKYLSLPFEHVQFILQRLERLGMVKKSGSEWTRGKNSIHLNDKSPLTMTNHQNWRTQAVIDSQLPKPGSVHYSSAFSISRKDLNSLREKIVALLDEHRQIVIDSKDEVIACYNCDLFEIGG